MKNKKEDYVLLNITMTQFIYHFVVYAEYTLQMTANFLLKYINCTTTPKTTVKYPIRRRIKIKIDDDDEAAFGFSVSPFCK